MYLTLKLLHIVAVVLFLGNITTGVFWKMHGDQSRDPRIVAHTLAGIIRSDRLFTVPGVVMILLFGFGAAGVGRLPLLGSDWILWSIVLFTVSGIAFMARLVPLQRRMLTAARAATTAEELDRGEYSALSRQWNVWGAIALLTPVAAMVLMVLKPVW